MTTVDRQLERRLARAGIVARAEEVERLLVYFALLRRWNKRINLTALPLDPASDQAIDRLIVEPLVAAPHMREPAQQWTDLGSGGGSPAIPMKITKPSSRLTMVEARSRKVAFLREVVRELELPDVDVVGERFESFSDQVVVAGLCDLVTARAVRPDVVFFSVARRLLRPSGRLLFFAGAHTSLKPSSPSFEILGTYQLIPQDTSVLHELIPSVVPRGTTTTT